MNDPFSRLAEPFLAHQRTLRGLSKRALAAAVGISPKTLRRVEGNRGPVRLRTARKIGVALGVDDLRSLGRIASRV